MPKAICVYSIAELAKVNPKVYAGIRREWQEHITHENPPFHRELVASAKAVCGLFCCKFDDTRRPLTWRKRTKDIRHPGTIHEFRTMMAVYDYWPALAAAPSFTGTCALTGYCSDDDFLEAIYKRLLADPSKPLGEAVRIAICTVAHQHERDDIKQQKSIESMHANMEDHYFTATGQRISKDCL